MFLLSSQRMRKAKNEIERFSFVNGHVMIIPIEDFDNTGE